MGGIPFLSLNIMGFPDGIIPDEILSDILKGASKKCIEANVSIGGGHSIRDKELKFGQAVIGFVQNNQIIDNSKAQIGDYILLTKPIGTGVVTTAKKLNGKVKNKTYNEALNIMLSLNKNARDVMIEYNITCATDITGFGLSGHLYEIASASNISIEIYSEKIPLIYDVMRLAEDGFFAGGAYSNLNYLINNNNIAIKFSDNITETMKLLLCDPQTSGGIAMFVNEKNINAVKNKLKTLCLSYNVIGRVVNKRNELITVI